jgi:preprotein translocase subunit Sss1
MQVLSPEIGKAAFRLAMLIVLLAAGLLVTLRPDTPEFAITVLTLLIGLIFVGTIAALVKVLGR